MRIPFVWCVRHRGGYCATADGKDYKQDEDHVRTLCNNVVTLPWGSARISPDCPECIKLLTEKKGKENGKEEGTA